MLLRGAMLSDASPLRVLRRDSDVLRAIVAALRAARRSHINWASRGVWPDLAAVNFPPPLVRTRPLSTTTTMRGTSAASGGRRQRTVSLLSGMNFFDHFHVESASASVRRDSRSLWRGLRSWAVEKGLYSSADAHAGGDGDYDDGGDDDDVDRQALVAALGDLVEPFHVNMMPIVMGRHASLPDKCKRYSALINLCLLYCPDEAGKVGYLTIHECHVEPGTSQRRPGLHIESPGYFQGAEDGSDYAAEFKHKMLHWGAGL
ncbi:hypothetical protein HK405_013772, partial [Cladochytrium tenue]